MIGTNTTANILDTDEVKDIQYFPIEGIPGEDSEYITDPLLEAVLQTQIRLREAKGREIKKARPILTQGDKAIIFPNTINVIQGHAGAHKSRLVETMCSAFLKRPGHPEDLLGFARTTVDRSHLVVYVDTERNLSEQLPQALQSILEKAGYKRDENPIEFQYISLLEINRNKRFTALNKFLEHLRLEHKDTPMFIVLDVATDCISDFNKVDMSMELIDEINRSVNRYNVAFMCLIHENPGSEKARGHIGTELMNKASTVMSVGFVKEGNIQTDLIQLKFLKCRGTARHAPIHLKYCDIKRGLILASLEDIGNVASSRQRSAPTEDVVEQLTLLLDDGSVMSREDLLKVLKERFEAKESTIEKRLKEIIETKPTIFNQAGQSCFLSKGRDKQVAVYSLKPIDTLASS